MGIELELRRYGRRYCGEGESIDVGLSHFVIQLLHSDDDFFSIQRPSIEDDIKESRRHRSEMMQLILEAFHSTDGVCIMIDHLDYITAIPNDNVSNGEDT